ncbi:hypothetical protein PoB_004783700 [Plakobranchus ocellatus]|uniref:Uncharacterized protein n=1 Tax=Plakobranchus ocellatus TaxID=259542 RepID=A0AAV4BQT9_9GAST|nr:hypothetical protein PoB_004783700 [Plakobranchus ocellatus]
MRLVVSERKLMYGQIFQIRMSSVIFAPLLRNDQREVGNRVRLPRGVETGETRPVFPPWPISICRATPLSLDGNSVMCFRDQVCYHLILL